MLCGRPYFFMIRLRSFSAAALSRLAVTTASNTSPSWSTAPKIAELAVDVHKHLIQMPAPLKIGAHVCASSLADLGGEHWAKPVPPEPDGLMADIDAALG